MTDFVTPARPLLLVGCGHMGSALLTGWLKNGLATDAVVVIEPAGPARAVAAGLSADRVFAIPPANIDPAFCLLAIKPQIFDKTLTGLSKTIGDNCVVMSVAAGQTVDSIRKLLPKAAHIVRAMPNMPAVIGAGVSVAFGEATLPAQAKEFCQQLLTAAGTVHWIVDEDLLDAVTALSGSGPAYVFYLIECLTAAGIAQGLPDDLAGELAVETVFGAGKLAKSSSHTPQELRRQVTSPGGTTQAGLEILMGEGGLAELIRHAVATAAKRARELRD